MIGRRTFAGALLLCTVVFCASVSDALATETGTTAVTCVKGGATNDFGDAHCDTAKAGGGYGHISISGKTSAVEGTSAATANETIESTSAVLTTTAGGLPVEIICKKNSSTGALENALTGEDHRILGSGIVIIYTECTVPLPAGQGCTVHSGEEPNGTIKTNSLKSESVESLMGHQFSSTGGGPMATLVFEACKTLGLNKAYEVTGTVTSEPSGTNSPNSAGATVVVNIPKTPASTLKVAGQPAGLSLSDTVKMEGGNPIATTAWPFTTNDETVRPGTTAVTCVKGGATNDYGDAHCDTAKAGGGYGHVSISGKTSEVEGTSTATANETIESTNAVLTTTAGGLATEIICKQNSSTGALENSLTGEDHRILGSGIVITYTECTVPLPAGQGCKVHSGEEPNGTIKTNSLKSESVESLMGQKFFSTSGGSITTLLFEGCKTAGLNKAYEVTGTVTSEPSGTNSPNSAGATVVVNLPKNASSTLKVAGQPAGLSLSDTIKMEGGNPIATTAWPFK